MFSRRLTTRFEYLFLLSGRRAHIERLPLVPRDLRGRLAAADVPHMLGSDRCVTSGLRYSNAGTDSPSLFWYLTRHPCNNRVHSAFYRIGGNLPRLITPSTFSDTSGWEAFLLLGFSHLPPKILLRNNPLGRPSLFTIATVDVYPQQDFMVLGIATYDGRKGSVSLMKTPRFEENSGIFQPAFAMCWGCGVTAFPFDYSQCFAGSSSAAFDISIAFANRPLAGHLHPRSLGYWHLRRHSLALGE